MPTGTAPCQCGSGNLLKTYCWILGHAGDRDPVRVSDQLQKLVTQHNIITIITISIVFFGNFIKFNHDSIQERIERRIDSEYINL